MASALGHSAVALLLVAAGSLLDVKDARGWRPITHAMYNGHKDFVGILHATPASLDVRPEMEAITPSQAVVVSEKRLLSHKFLQGTTRVRFVVKELSFTTTLQQKVVYFFVLFYFIFKVIFKTIPC